MVVVPHPGLLGFPMITFSGLGGISVLGRQPRSNILPSGDSQQSWEITFAKPCLILSLDEHPGIPLVFINLHSPKGSPPLSIPFQQLTGFPVNPFMSLSPEHVRRKKPGHLTSSPSAKQGQAAVPLKDGLELCQQLQRGLDGSDSLTPWIPMVSRTIIRDG